MAHMLMNGITAHAFAAVMTATVVLFPTPSDLWDTVTRKPISSERARVLDTGVDRPELVSLTPQTSTSAITEALEYCAENFSGLLSAQVAECQSLMAFAARRIGREADTPQAVAIENQLSLTITLYCRHQWADAQQFNRPFDIQDCQNGLAGLADSS